MEDKENDAGRYNVRILDKKVRTGETNYCSLSKLFSWKRVTSE